MRKRACKQRKQAPGQTPATHAEAHAQTSRAPGAHCCSASAGACASAIVALRRCGAGACLPQHN
eukprot:2999331-Lingulodinium_polyedra.AAC.1